VTVSKNVSPVSDLFHAVCVIATSKRRASVSGSSSLQGRLIDHLRNTQSVGLEDLQALVLDEADRLLEMGFAEEVSFLSNVSNPHLEMHCFREGCCQCVCANACVLKAVQHSAVTCW